MRNIEKGVLLAEFFNADTSKYVPSFIKWIKNTEAYSQFNEKYNILKGKRTWKARRYYSYFETIDLDSVTTIKDAMIEYGKICYLNKITSEKSYINPLIIENIDDPNMTIGDIQIEFDGKIISLKELCKLEGFSFERKEILIKEKIDNWVNEIETSIIKPLEEYKEYDFYLPKIKVLNLSRAIELIYLVIINTLMVVINFIKIPLFENVFINKNSLEYSLYVLTLGFILVYDLIFIITLIIRQSRYGYYRKARNAVLEDIFIEKDKCEMKLRKYIYKELSTYGDMDAKVSDFSKTSKYYRYIGYIRKRIAMKKRVKVDKVNVGEKTGFIVSLLVLVLFFVIILI